jgi:hypothetical protein
MLRFYHNRQANHYFAIKLNFHLFCRCTVGCDSSVGTATRYKLDGPGIEYDDLQHRLAEYGEGRLMWDWTKGQTCENPTNYLETDTGRMDDEAAI